MSPVPYVPEGTFLHNYMRYMSTQETPQWYDFMCGCWVLSSALGRDVIVNRPRAPVRFNMYVILVSESGIMRKSSSINIATGVLREFFSSTKDEACLTETRVSHGQLLNELSRATQKHGHAHSVLVASELAAVLSRGAAAGLVALLTDMYDCPDKRVGGGSLSSGGFNYANVYSCFLAGSTPTWLARAVRPEVIEGGFTSRCYFVQGRNRKQLVPWPADTDDAELRLKLVQQLKEIQDASRTYPRIGISAAALNTFSAWYKDRDHHKDAYRESFESREDAHVLRFAGLAAINEQAWLIDDHHTRRAINIVAELKRYGAGMFTDARAGVGNMRLAKRLRDRLLAAGDTGIARFELRRSLSISGRQGDEFTTLLRLFHELDLVKVFEFESDVTGGRPKQVFVATKYLANEQFLEDVANKLGV